MERIAQNFMKVAMQMLTKLSNFCFLSFSRIKGVPSLSWFIFCKSAKFVIHHWADLLFFVRVQVRLSFIRKKPSASPKIWKTKWKNSKIQKCFDLGQELVRPAHLKAQWIDFFKDLTGIKTNGNHWRFSSFYI